MLDILSKKVLLLNSSYEPISIINSKKAIIMLMLGKVDYIEKGNKFIKSEKIQFLLPVVVKLKAFVYLKRRRIALTRQNIFKRDNLIVFSDTRIMMVHAYTGFIQ